MHAVLTAGLILPRISKKTRSHTATSSNRNEIMTTAWDLNGEQFND
jgi:hypothetical protein